MGVIKELIKNTVNGIIGVIVCIAIAKATELSWNSWLVGVIGFFFGWLLLSKGFWEEWREAFGEKVNQEKEYDNE